MESQHFSHKHLLFTLQLDEGGENILCKACERLIVEPFHGCIACNYYLHDQCLNTPRWLKHPSHCLHSLVLQPTPTYSTGSYICSACGFSGNAFSLSCAECEFDLHVHCANLPRTVHLDSHPHELQLTFDFPHKEKTTSMCDVCAGSVNHQHWVYYCAYCDFGTHLGCATYNKQQVVSTTNKQQDQWINNQAPRQPGTTQPSSSVNDVAHAIDSFKDTANEMMKNQFEMMRVQSEMENIRTLTRSMNYYY